MVMMMMAVAMTVTSNSLSVGFVTMLMTFLFLFVAVTMTVSMIMFFSEVGMLVEESHTDNINNKSDDSYDNHLARVDDGRVVDSLKGFNEDIETDEYQEDTVDKAG